MEQLVHAKRALFGTGGGSTRETTSIDRGSILECTSPHKETGIEVYQYTHKHLETKNGAGIVWNFHGKEARCVTNGFFRGWRLGASSAPPLTRVVLDLCAPTAVQRGKRKPLIM